MRRNLIKVINVSRETFHIDTVNYTEWRAIMAQKITRTVTEGYVYTVLQLDNGKIAGELGTITTAKPIRQKDKIKWLEENGHTELGLEGTSFAPSGIKEAVYEMDIEMFIQNATRREEK